MKLGRFVCILSLCLSGPTLVAQTNAPVSGPAKAQPQIRQAGEQIFGLKDGTPIELKTTGTVSSANARVGEKLDFEAAENVVVQGICVIPKGSIVSGRVIAVKPKRRLGRGDQLSLSIDSLTATDGERVWLRGERDTTGGNHVAAMTGAMAASGVFFFPATPFFLWLHGKHAIIPVGTALTAYVDGDTPLNRANFKSVTAVGTEATTARLSISSVPAGADIEVDGRVAGIAPVGIDLRPGEHHVVVRKAGFSTWDQKISISPGETLISVELIAH